MSLPSAFLSPLAYHLYPELAGGYDAIFAILLDGNIAEAVEEKWMNWNAMYAITQHTLPYKIIIIMPPTK